MKVRKSQVAEEWRDSDGYWIALKPGWKSGSDPLGNLHTIHEDTSALAWAEPVMPCHCQECYLLPGGTMTTPQTTINLPESATWSGKCVDMRLKRNKDAFERARHTSHVRRICVATNSFTGSRMAWEFSNELIRWIERTEAEQDERCLRTYLAIQESKRKPISTQ